MGKKKNITAFSDQADFDAFLSGILTEPKPDLDRGYLLVKRGYDSLVDEKKDLEKERRRESARVAKLTKKRPDSPKNENNGLQNSGDSAQKSFAAFAEKLKRAETLVTTVAELAAAFSDLENRRIPRFMPVIRRLHGEPDSDALDILSAATYAYGTLPTDFEMTDLVRTVAEAQTPSQPLLVNLPVHAAVRFANHNTQRQVSYYSTDEFFAEVTGLIGVPNLDCKGVQVSPPTAEETELYDCIVVSLEPTPGIQESASKRAGQVLKRDDATDPDSDSCIEDFSQYFDLCALAGRLAKGGRIIALASSDLTLGAGRPTSVLGTLEKKGLSIAQILSQEDSEVLLFVIEHKESKVGVHLGQSRLQQLAIAELWDDPEDHRKQIRAEFWNILQRKPGRIAGDAVMCAGQRPVSPDTHRITSDASAAAKDMGYLAREIAEVFETFELKPAIDKSYLKKFDREHPTWHYDPAFEEVAGAVHDAAERVDPRSYYFSSSGELTSGLEFLQRGDAGGDWQSHFDASAFIKVRPGSSFVPGFFNFWMNTAPGNLLRHLVSEGKAGSNEGLNARCQRAIALGKCMFIPPVEVQALLMDTVSNLERIGEESEQRRISLTQDIENLTSLHRQVKDLSLEESETAWVASLPYFLSIILQSYRREPSAKSKYKLLETFFEQVTQFYSIILLSCLQMTSRKNETYADLTKYLRKHHHSLSEPSFGLWRTIHDFLRGHFQGNNSLAELIFGAGTRTSSDWILSSELAAISKRVNALRNEEGEAHGGSGSEKFYENLLSEMRGHLNSYRELSGNVFREVIFYQLAQSENLGDVSDCIFRRLVGHSERFEIDKTTTDHEPRELISNALYLSGDELNTLIPIVPLLRMDREAAISVAAFYNGRKGDKYRFKSFQELDSPNQALEDQNFERRLQKYLSIFES